MTVTQVLIKFLNTNYIFLGILGRPGRDPIRVMTGLVHDRSRVMTQSKNLGHDPQHWEKYRLKKYQFYVKIL
jgi:hypothetical protein